MALTPVDESICALIDSLTNRREHLFYLRFVDDLVLLSDNPENLQNGIDVLQRALDEFAGHRVQVNTAKAKPSGVKAYLRGLERKGREGRQGKVPLGNRLRPDDYLTRKNLELFTTSVVREMSGLADESLEEHFGAPGIERLEELMELAALEIDDFEVGADARLSFAVNRLARAAWPDGRVVCEDTVMSREDYIRRIMLIAETSLRRHPWRYKLWRSVIIIALRGETLGRNWLLRHVLPLVSWAQAERPSGQSSQSCEMTEADEHSWSNKGVLEHDGDKIVCSAYDRLHDAHHVHCRERVSFHRTEFWRQWAACIRTLKAISTENEEPSARSGDGPRSLHPGRPERLWSGLGELPISQKRCMGSGSGMTQRLSSGGGSLRP